MQQHTKTHHTCWHRYMTSFKWFIYQQKYNILHGMIYSLYAAKFLVGRRQGSLAYRAVYLNTKHEYVNTVNSHYITVEYNCMNYYPFVRVKSWNNGVRCMSFCILTILKTVRKEENETSLRLLTQKRHPTPRPFGPAMEHPFWIFWRKYTARYRDCTVLWAENRESLWHRPSESRIIHSDDSFGIIATIRS